MDMVNMPPLDTSHIIRKDELEILEQNGYAKFNRCDHLCVDLPDEQFTITARTKDGRRITFAYNPYEDVTKGCMDISFHDSGRKNDNGIPEFDASVRAQGPLLYATKDQKATLVIVPMTRS